MFIAASGHYMLATTKFKQPDMMAHIVSPYILAGDDTCIQVYYQTQGGVLNIRTVATDSTLTTGTVSVLSFWACCVWERGRERDAELVFESGCTH